MNCQMISDWQIAILHHRAPRLSVYSAPELYKQWTTAHILGNVDLKGVMRTSPVKCALVVDGECRVQTESGSTYTLRGAPIDAYQFLFPADVDWADAEVVQRHIAGVLPAAVNM